MLQNELLEQAWSLISNAGGGSWITEGDSWSKEARKFQVAYSSRMFRCKDSNLLAHAEREMKLANVEEDVQRWMLGVIAEFIQYGHSGSSAEICKSLLHDLLNRQALTPLTDDPDEWEDRSVMSGYPLWQNKRDSRAMSNDGGKTYWTVDPEIPNDMRPIYVTEHKEETDA